MPSPAEYPFLPDSDEIEVLIWDWDGTLVDSGEINFQAFRHAMAAHGMVVTWEWYEHRASMTTRELLVDWAADHGPKSAVNICDSDNDCFQIFDIEYALQQQGYVGSQGGDSGAPVFALDGTGVRIKGVVSGVLAADQRMLTYQGWDSISSRFGLSGVVTR